MLTGCFYYIYSIPFFSTFLYLFRKQWQGDSYCDDENNTPGCNYDGGDCCGGSTIYCSVCECKQMAGR